MSAFHKIDDDEMSPRGLAAREILATARANLAGHVGRNERVARELARARANIAQLDPNRLASTVASRLRQERVARTLRNARDTVARLADMQGPTRLPAQMVYKTKINARLPETVRPPSPVFIAREPAPQGEASYYEICREAIVEFTLGKFDQERARRQQDIDGLRREVDGLVRELDLVRRQPQESS